MKPIVVVDDDVDFLSTLEGILSGNATPLISFASPRQARNYLRQCETPLLLLDFDMPGCNGLELLQRYRSWPHGIAPALLFTAHQDPELLYAGFANGLDDFLYKPFDHKELQLRVQSLLRRSTSFLEKTQRPPASFLPSEAALLCLRLDREACHMVGFAEFLLVVGRSLAAALRPHPVPVFFENPYLFFRCDSGKTPDLVRKLKAIRKQFQKLPEQKVYYKMAESYLEEKNLEPPRLLYLPSAHEKPTFDFLEELFASTDAEFLHFD